jgi:type I site-specific restriction-modification system R (restriction) subunit
MPKKLHKVLAINPGSRYFGMAVFKGYELDYWGIKNINATDSGRKKKKIKTLISAFIEKYESDALAIKRLHRLRSSKQLNRLVSSIKQVAKGKGLNIYQYSIKDLEAFFSPEKRINKRKLSEIVALKYPSLLHELNKEKHNKNPYHIRAFEAVALGAVCSHQLDKN